VYHNLTPYARIIMDNVYCFDIVDREVDIEDKVCYYINVDDKKERT